MYLVNCARLKKTAVPHLNNLVPWFFDAWVGAIPDLRRRSIGTWYKMGYPRDGNI